MELSGKKVLVVGLGKSGKEAALLLKKLGAVPKVTDNSKSEEIEQYASELSGQGIACELGTHSASFMEGAELVVVSPGVPDESQAIKWANEKGIPIISEIELAYNFCKAPIVAISGTNGKSTVTTLTGELIKNAGKKVFVGGNLGTPFSSGVLGLDAESIAVLEISSFQLERIKSFKPKVAVLLNVTQDHLDRYPVFDEYFEAKKRIFLNQDRDDYAILNFDSPKIKALAKAIKSKPFYFSKHRLSKEFEGAYVENEELIIRHEGKFKWITSVDELGLGGDHNIHNYLASAMASYLVGVDPESMTETISKFTALPHRFEQVDTVKGVRFIDDSKATNVDSVIKALDSCASRVVLIAGGRDKGSDYRPLANSVRRKVKELVLLGEAKEKIAKALEKTKPISFTSSLDEAVKVAYEKASKGDIVLLSPICASFDMFKSYKERGNAFRQAIEGLKKSKTK